MATLLLSAAGAAIGQQLAGPLGVMAPLAGRAIGAFVGNKIDQHILGEGSDAVSTESPRQFRLNGAEEGAPIARVYGRNRVAGHVIWASQVREVVDDESGGGKGTSAPSQSAKTTRYYINLAIGLCEGEISHIARVWADSEEIPRDSINMRLYHGAQNQSPDPLMEAIEGAGQVPAYNGTAYVVLEDLELNRFGNRIPHFSFELCRPTQVTDPDAAYDPAHSVSGVALLPGTGEYSLATTPVKMAAALGETRLINVNSVADKPDLLVSLDDLTGELPNAQAVSLVVSWFGNDLRAGSCTITPRVEQKNIDAENMPWNVCGLRRAQALRTPQDDNQRPVYGGTPTDQSVIEAIKAFNASGKEVMFYPFVLMTQMQGNGLADPYSDADDQAVLPWRGRITLNQAPLRPGSDDGTAAAVADVEAFFGTAQVDDFSILTGFGNSGSGAFEPGQTESAPVPTPSEGHLSPVSYSGPQEWGYRRFILHNAMLCLIAGGVESFCIGSELRGLTQIRGPGDSFPAVEALIELAADVRSILGPDVKISYAADWSEYFGYHPGGGECFFHLDPLWADENIDFIGIDNYMPLSDWRDDEDHADAAWGSVYNLEYLKANIAGGEGYDWYYHSVDAEAAQIRTPITDKGEAEPWVWRYKDLRNWCSKLHHDRPGGIRSKTPTAWVPGSKPIRFTEYGCAAINKGTNQPNKFLDSKSSESALPKYSDGQRDELMQMQYLRAMNAYWRAPENNPVSELYQRPMLDVDRAYVWAWDVRPYPHFPASQDIWSDGLNYARGHWLTGRASGWTLAGFVRDIAGAAGVKNVDTSELYGYVRGYLVSGVEDARTQLQSAMLCYGFESFERDGKLIFRNRDCHDVTMLDPEYMVRDKSAEDVIERSKDTPVELPGRVSLRFVEADGTFAVASEEARLPSAAPLKDTGAETALVLTRNEARQAVARWLSEAQIAAERVHFSLPGSLVHLGAGAVVDIPDVNDSNKRYRIDRVELVGLRTNIEAVRVDGSFYKTLNLPDEFPATKPFVSSAPVLSHLIDPPLLLGDETPHAPYLFAYNNPWPQAVAVYTAEQDAGYRFVAQQDIPTRFGVLTTPLFEGRPDLIDRGNTVDVRMLNGQLQSIDRVHLLAGGNLAILSDGSVDLCEVIQFQEAELIGPETYRLRYLICGLRGTERIREDAWPTGSYLILPGAGFEQLPFNAEMRGLPLNVRIGPAAQPLDHVSYKHDSLILNGNGLRPYAPAHVRSDRQTNGDLVLRWTRRGRVDADRWETPDIPLGEERESYLVTVRRAGQVVREEVVEVPTWTYRDENMLNDEVIGEPVEFSVAQISGHYGVGRAAVVVRTL